MSAMVVVLKPFSPFSGGDAEVDLGQLPPPPTDDEVDPIFHSEPAALHIICCLLHPCGRVFISPAENCCTRNVDTFEVA